MSIDTYILWASIVLKTLGFLSAGFCLLGVCKIWQRRVRCLLVLVLLGLSGTVLTAAAFSSAFTASIGLTSAVLWLLAITPPCGDWQTDPYTLIYAAD